MLTVSPDILQHARNLVDSVYAPLTGFLRADDFKRVVREMRLANGAIWPIPIVCDAREEDYERLKDEDIVRLTNEAGEVQAVITHPQWYTYDKNEYVTNVFGTADKNHPGVARVMEKGTYLVGGDVEWVGSAERPFGAINRTPKQTRTLFQEKKWHTVVAFQTRNVPHRSHEYLQKLALQQVDGLFIQPVIGKKKAGDFKDEVIVQAYEMLVEKYYPRERVAFGILPLAMHYAGPREAVLHALVRKNYGCTHMIIGRDHAGVGEYYGTYDAQAIFKQFAAKELGIMILPYENVAFCEICDELASEKSCPHAPEQKIFLSGTKVREMVKQGEDLPPQFTRPEISNLLLNHKNPFVE